MHASRERIQTILEGKTPDRPALFDLVRNDAVLEHFSGRRLNLDNAADLIYKVLPDILDGTRPGIAVPKAEEINLLADGRKQTVRRWTTWTEPRIYASSLEYKQVKTKAIEESGWGWSAADQEALAAYLRNHLDLCARLNGMFLFWSSCANPGLMMHTEVGLEAFAYFLADCPEVISLQLEYNTVKGIQRIERLPAETGIGAVFLGDDIAFKDRVMFAPKWLRQEYFPRLKRVVAAFHKKGVKVMFHSDGSLMEILDDLVESGIDLLNPIEVTAGMDIKEIHRRHPHLVMAGGIDVSQLLPFGTPAQVRDAVKRAVADAEGKILVGSSTELLNEVPLENFLAMRETVLNWR